MPIKSQDNTQQNTESQSTAYLLDDKHVNKYFIYQNQILEAARLIELEGKTLRYVTAHVYNHQITQEAVRLNHMKFMSTLREIDKRLKGGDKN